MIITAISTWPYLPLKVSCKRTLSSKRLLWVHVLLRAAGDARGRAVLGAGRFPVAKKPKTKSKSESKKGGEEERSRSLKNQTGYERDRERERG